VVFFFDVGVGFFFYAEGRKIEGAGLDRRPIDDHGDGAIDLHFVHGPTGKVEGGSLSSDQSAALQIEAGGAGRGDHRGDAACASDGNMRAGRVHGGGGDEFGIVITEFADVHRGVHGADFVQADLRDRIEHAGIDFE